MRFAVYGIGGFGREVAPLVREQLRSLNGGTAGHYDLVFVDDSEDRPTMVNGIATISFEELCGPAHNDRQIVVAVGDGRTREKIENRLQAAGLHIGHVHAPTARVLDGNTFGPGAVLCDNVVITSNATIGRSFQANIYSYVAHDCVIGDYVTFAPRVSCNGNVHVHDYAYIGTGALFVQGKDGSPLVIGEGAMVGMGSVVTKSVEPYTLVVGSPARPLRQLKRPEAE